MPTDNQGPAPVASAETGTPVLFLHSSGLSGRQWKGLAKTLAGRGFRALVPDLTGHGGSQPWPEPTPFSFPIDVDRLVEMLDGFEGPVHLVGHSYGGFLALLVALARPARVRSLALYDPVAFGALGPDDDDARRTLDAVPPAWEATDEGRERWLQAFVDYWSGPGAWVGLKPEARDEFKRVGWVLSQGVFSLVRDATPASAYGSLDVPVLLLTGERTPLAARRVVQRLGASFPHATIEVVAGAGHMGPLTHAEAVNGAIATWLSNLEGAS